jgi:hypothetical protein
LINLLEFMLFFGALDVIKVGGIALVLLQRKRAHPLLFAVGGGSPPGPWIFCAAVVVAKTGSYKIGY